MIVSTVGSSRYSVSSSAVHGTWTSGRNGSLAPTTAVDAGSVRNGSDHAVSIMVPPTHVDPLWYSGKYLTRHWYDVFGASAPLASAKIL